MSEGKQLYGADLVVDSLINHDVKYVFGIPGAKIDRVFDTLEDKGPELIVARHEQNAAFMAQGVGRITGTSSSTLRCALAVSSTTAASKSGTTCSARTETWSRWPASPISVQSAPSFCTTSLPPSSRTHR